MEAELYKIIIIHYYSLDLIEEIMAGPITRREKNE